MGFRNFLIWLIKNLVVLLIATLIFSSITLNFPDLIKGVFGDIFAYASPDAQKQVIGKLAESCSSLEQGQNAVTISQICTNKTLLESMKENCTNYRELKIRSVQIENEQQVKETCQQIESGDIEMWCNELKQKISFAPDFSSIGALCKDYKAGRINDREFFFNVISGAMPSNAEMPRMGALEKYNQTINYLNKNKLIYFVVLAVLLIILYLLIIDIKSFIITLTGISFSIGILIMLPYFAVLAYDKFVGIDTTPLLGSMLGAGGIFDLKSIISVLLLLFLRTYNSLIITLGVVFLSIGIAGKVYGFALKRQPTKKEARVEEKIKAVEKQVKKKKKKS